MPIAIHAIFVGPHHRLCVCRNNTGKVVEYLSSDTGGVGTLIPEGQAAAYRKEWHCNGFNGVYICESEYNI